MNQYIVIALVVAAAVGWGGWQKIQRNNAQLEAEAVRASLVMAEKEAQDAATIAKHNKTVADSYKDEVIRQREIAAEAKAKERLAWMARDKLKKDIANVTENPPVPDAIELVLESVRLRSAVSGTPGAPDGDEDRDNGEAGVSGRDVSASPDPAAEAPGS